jgi:hypothetical protein
VISAGIAGVDDVPGGALYLQRESRLFQNAVNVFANEWDLRPPCGSESYNALPCTFPSFKVGRHAFRVDHANRYDVDTSSTRVAGKEP